MFTLNQLLLGAMAWMIVLIILLTLFLTALDRFFYPHVHYWCRAKENLKIIVCVAFVVMAFAFVSFELMLRTIIITT